MNGVLLIDKPQEFTSFDVVAKLRGILKMKKIGHAGTLDPMATGVLPVFLGEATKLCEYLQCDEKIYEAGLLLGRATDTEDIWGQTVCEKDSQVPEDELREAILSFKGHYLQTPPMYSAKKVNGKKLYEYARAGIEIERKPEPHEIFRIDIQSLSTKDAHFTVACSGGTYIRTLCTDIGKKLGQPACMMSLRRLKHGRFEIKDAITLLEAERLMKEGRIEERIIPIENLFDYPEAYVNEAGEKRLKNGNLLDGSHFEDGLPVGDHIRVYDIDRIFRGIYLKDDAEGIYRPEKMFLH